MYGIALSSRSRLLSYTSASQPKTPSPGTLRISSPSLSAFATTQENNRKLSSASRPYAREKRSHLSRTSLALSDSHMRLVLPPGQTYHASWRSTVASALPSASPSRSRAIPYSAYRTRSTSSSFRALIAAPVAHLSRTRQPRNQPRSPSPPMSLWTSTSRSRLPASSLLLTLETSQEPRLASAPAHHPLPHRDRDHDPPPLSVAHIA